MKSIKLTDQESRNLIVSDLKHNYFVEASAGSGKTTSLVYRMVALVEAGVPVNKICTITFTVAAANEFFSRFQSLLSLRSVPGDDETISLLGKKSEESINRCLNALNNIDLCFNGTMDSFCNMVAHELPTELDIPSDAKVVSDDEIDQYIAFEYFNLLTDKNHPLYQEAVRFNKVIKDPYLSFTRGIKEIYSYRDKEVVYSKDLLNVDLDKYLHKEKEEFFRLIELLRKEGYDYLSNASIKTKCRKVFAKRHKIKNTSWNECVNDVLDSLSAFTDAAKFSKEIAGSEFEVSYLEEGSRSYSYSSDVLDLINVIKTNLYEYQFEIYFSLLCKAKEEITKKMKSDSKFTFYDFLYYLTMKFKESASSNRELIEHVYERHSYILIDESQDTDPLQTELFFYLTSTQKTDDWRKAEPKEGSLFIVGDPKQSIYGFRGADVHTYSLTKDLFNKKGEVLYLTKNYRSNYLLKEYFNRSMNKVLNVGLEPTEHPDIPLEIESEKEKIRYELENSKEVTLNGVYKYSGNKKSEEDALIVSNIIQDLVHNPEYKIISKKTNKIREIDYKDILVITRGKRIDSYVKEFAINEIPFMVEANVYFDKSESFISLISLVGLLNEPTNRKYFVDVTHLIYKFECEDILKMLSSGYDLDISKDIEDITITDNRYLKAINELHQLYLSSRHMSVSSMLFYLLSNKDYLFLNKVDKSFLEYAYYLVELVKTEEKNQNITSYEDAKTFFNKLINGESGIERALRFKENADQVKISNLHKVKGLQAPIVILAKPSEKKQNETKYVDAKNKKVYYSSIEYQEDNYLKVICKSEKYKEEMLKASENSLSELGRLQYVAATRAESVLIIAEASTNANFYNPWDELLLGDEEYLPSHPQEKEHLATVSTSDLLKSYHPIINEESNSATYRVISPSAYRIRGFSNVDEIEEIDPNIDKSELGTLIHRLLECIVTSKNKYQKFDLIEKVQKEALTDKYFDILNHVYDEFVSSDMLKKLLNAKVVMCEVPFSYKNEEKIVNGVIDCLYEDDSGYHIIDYKTNLESDTSKLKEEYQIQLRMYQKALKEAYDIKADANIYHIDVNI